MNMIFCNSDCIHQKEGVCLLERTVDALGEIDDDCYYFTPSKPKSEENQ